MFGSKEMSELKLRPFCEGCACGWTGDLLGPAPGDEKLNCIPWLLNWFCGVAVALPRGAENVNAACLSTIFSFWRRVSSSRKFSFSCSLS